MDIQRIEEKVIEVLAEKTSLDPERINLESSLVDDLGLDSMDAVEMVFELEESYGTDIPDEEIPKFKVPRDIIKYLSKILVER